MNPFLNVGYQSPLYFCDRDSETKQLLQAIRDGRSITLHSIRRIGKTGLVKHLFYKLRRKKEYLTVYIDIFDSSDAADFTSRLISHILPRIEKNESSFLKLVTRFFGRYRPSISVDPLTGQPNIYLDIQSIDDVKISLDTLFQIISEQKKKVIIAIDEFQQIQMYKDKTIAAMLRRYLQSMDNLIFIFSGSQTHLLLDIFSSPKKAFFGSTQLFPLDKINPNQYAKFIKFHFDQGLRPIPGSLVEEILSWTKTHTYYTQTFCQRLYSFTDGPIKQKHLDQIKIQILREQEAVYKNYMSLLSPSQWKLLVAIGKEEIVHAPTSARFINQHQLGAHSTVRQSLRALLDNELIYLTIEDQKKHYQVYDVFLARWVQRFG